MKTPAPQILQGEEPIPGPAEIDSTSVTLRFFGDDLDPDELSRVLGADPTVAHAKGAVVPGPDKERTAQTGSWLLSSERQSKNSLEAQIHALFDRLTDDLEVWHRLTARYRADLFCGLWAQAWSRGLQLSPEALSRIAERGLRIGFEITFVE